MVVALVEAEKVQIVVTSGTIDKVCATRSTGGLHGSRDRKAGVFEAA